MTCVSIGMMILSMFGFDVDQSYQVMVVLGIAVVGLATFSTSFRDAIATALPPYLRDMIFNDDDPQRPQQRPQRTQQDEEWTDIADKIRNTPIETYTASLSSLSSKELKKRLKNRDVDTSYCVERKELLDRLMELNLQSDLRFAEMLIRSRLFRGQGRRRIEQELRQHAIDPHDVSRFFDQAEDTESGRCLAALEKWMRGKKDPTRDKALRFLASRGFNFSDATEAVDAIFR